MCIHASIVLSVERLRVNGKVLMSDRAKQLIGWALVIMVALAVVTWNDVQVKRDGGRYGPDQNWHTYSSPRD
jgi:hypothetical protein